MSLPDGWSPERVEKVREWAGNVTTAPFLDERVVAAGRFVLDVLAQAEPVGDRSLTEWRWVALDAQDATVLAQSPAPCLTREDAERRLAAFRETWAYQPVVTEVESRLVTPWEPVVPAPAPAEPVEGECPHCGYVGPDGGHPCPPAPAEGAGEEGGCGHADTNCDVCTAPLAAPVGADQQGVGLVDVEAIQMEAEVIKVSQIGDRLTVTPLTKALAAFILDPPASLPSIPVPEGWEPVEWRVPVVGEFFLTAAGMAHRWSDPAQTSPRLVLRRTTPPAPDPLPAREQLVKALIETCNPARRPSEWAVSLIADHADTLRAAADAAEGEA